MSTAYHRKKQPETVRRALLDQAAQLAADRGLAAVTVQAVSDAAGVTKGGFLHHFASKQALIDVVFKDMLTSLDTDIERHIAADSHAYGSFTRAYLATVLTIPAQCQGTPGTVLTLSMLADPHLRVAWATWIEQRLEQHHATDADAELTQIRLAADGIWLADLTGIHLPDREEVVRALRARTYRPGTDSQKSRD